MRLSHKKPLDRETRQKLVNSLGIEPDSWIETDARSAYELSQAQSLKRIADTLGDIDATLTNLLVHYVNGR